MRNYFRNWELFIKGFRWLWTRRKATKEECGPGDIHYFEGWGPWSFLPVYAVDCGLRVMFGGAVITWSRTFFDNKEKYHTAKFLDRLLQKVDDKHGEESGTALWGSVPCRMHIQVKLFLFWAASFFSLYWFVIRQVSQ